MAKMKNDIWDQMNAAGGSRACQKGVKGLMTGCQVHASVFVAASDPNPCSLRDIPSGGIWASEDRRYAWTITSPKTLWVSGIYPLPSIPSISTLQQDRCKPHLDRIWTVTVCWIGRVH
uniref:ARAD1C21692p n=1 Tax=Blastobotrys adeninivorans TaxID=409370 RepID=A0A060T6N8_BLAAD